jgi:glycosyltransferase involved in cell wall biosynthesis
MEISVVIPSYNEEENIQRTVERCVRSLRALFDRFEIIIVDDKSTDNTGKIADDLSNRHPEVRAIHNEYNLRQGASLVHGFKQARLSLVTHNAMDYPFNLDDLPKMLALMERADIVVGARRNRPEFSWYRWFLSAVNLLLLRNFFDLRLRDYNFVQIYKREVLEAINFEETSTGFLVPSILFQAHRLGYRIEEIVIDCLPRERGEAKSGRPRVLLETLWDMFRFWVRQKLNTKRRSVSSLKRAE